MSSVLRHSLASSHAIPSVHQASLFPRPALQSLAHCVLSHASFTAVPRAAAALLLFDLRASPVDAVPTAARPEEAQAATTSTPSDSDKLAVPGTTTDAPPPPADADAVGDDTPLAIELPASLLEQLRACGDAMSLAAPAVSALVAVLAGTTHGTRAGVLSLLALHQLPDACTLAVCRALEASPEATAPLGAVAHHAFLAALLRVKASALTSPPSRHLVDALAAAARGAPAVTASAVSAPLLLSPSPPGDDDEKEVNPRAAVLVHRVLDGSPGDAHATSLLLALCVDDGGSCGGSRWTSHLLPAVSRIITARPAIPPATLMALTSSCETAACGPLGRELNFVKLCATLATAMEQPLRQQPLASAALRRAVASTKTFLTDATLARLDAGLAKS